MRCTYCNREHNCPVVFEGHHFCSDYCVHEWDYSGPMRKP